MAIVGDLSIETEDGTVLHATSDLGLAWRWAEWEVNQCAELRPWDELSYREQINYAAQALAELRRSAGSEF